jgi:peroxiredoxin
MTKTLLTALALLLALLLPRSWAQTASPQPFTLQGQAANGQTFDLSRQRGRVVMLVYWDTGCAVCRSKLPELRRNLLGWKDRPFDLVTISLDRREADWRHYEQLQASTQAEAAQRSIALWAGMPGFRHSLALKSPRLPLTLVIDTDGRVRHQYEGRMAPEAWDLVAELLP